MLTVLAVLGVLAVLFLAAAVATSDREVLVEAPPDGADLDLPSGRMEPADVGRLRFGLVLRGYRMGEVDAALDRLTVELAERDRALAEALAPSPADRDAAAAHAVTDLTTEAPVDEMPTVDEVPVGAAPVAAAPVAAAPVAAAPVEREPADVEADTDADADGGSGAGTEPTGDPEPAAGRTPDEVRR